MAATHDNQNGSHRQGLALQTRHRIALSFSLLLLVVAAAWWGLFRSELDRSLSEYNAILGASLAEQTAASVRELVLVNDLLGLNVELNQLVSDSSVVYVAVHDVDGNQLASAGRRLNAIDGPPLYSADINVQDAIAGAVQLALDTSAVDTFRTRQRNLFLLILAAALVLVTTTAFALAGRITAPLQALGDAIRERTGDDEPADGDETARLQAAVEALLDRASDMEERLLETGVWQKADDDADSEPARQHASIFVVKVVNSNTAIELLHPSTLGNLLREYVFYLNQAARLYGGSFHRLNGESVLVCFDANDCGDRHGVNALYCAGLFMALMARINARHREKGEQVLEFRMAIHSGDVFHAPRILPDGKSSRATDGLIGQTIDIAYFLCKKGAPNTLVLSESASSQAREFESFVTSGQHEFSMPAENMSFIAYSLSGDFAGNMALVQKQLRHILGNIPGIIPGPNKDAE